jgi:hypothetical protein
MSRQVKVMKIELQVIDFEGCSDEDTVHALESCKYIDSVKVKWMESVVVDWDEFGEDNHPLNKSDTQDAEYKRLFEGK